MACDRKTLTLVSCYADGEATSEEAVRAIAHLEHCAECRALTDEWHGQRQMFEWAYTALPEDTEIRWQELVAEGGRGMSTADRMSAVPTMLYRNRLAWAGALAAAAFMITLMIYNFAVLPPVLKAGAEIASDNVPQAARMGGNIRLELGPNSKISRVGDTTIGLEKGWVFASVEHGSGLRVLTRRIEVLDQGTRFKVGTGAKLDYVVVEEGSVSVRDGKNGHDVHAGQTLIAQDDQEAYVASFPDEPGDPGVPLDKQDSGFTPRTGEDLDWDEGLRRLAAQFPNARLLSSVGSVGKASWSREVEDAREYVAIAPASNLRSGLRTHFHKIVQAMAGEKVDSGGWEIPVGIVQFSSISSDPSFQDDVYYVRLVPANGTVVWRFNGSRGRQTDLPLRTEKTMFTSGQPLVKYSDFVQSGGSEHIDEVFVLGEWPQKIRPAFKLRLLPTTRVSDSQRDKLLLLSEITRQVSGVKEFDPSSGISTLLYLDTKRKHRFLIMWNREAGKQLCRLSDLLKNGRGGSVILGALATDAPLEQPEAGAGVYLLRFVSEGSTKSPHLEIATPDTWKQATWGSSSHALGSKKSHIGGGSSWSPESLPGYGRIMLSCRADDGSPSSFRFHFQVIGRPDDTSTRPIKTETGTEYRHPTKIWAEGSILVRKP